MINRRCRSCGVQLPMRSPAAECRQCRYKRGTSDLVDRLFVDVLGRGCEMIGQFLVDATCAGIKAAKKVQPIRGALAARLANAQIGGG